jgi:hypothetical protein
VHYHTSFSVRSVGTHPRRVAGERWALVRGRRRRAATRRRAGHFRSPPEIVSHAPASRKVPGISYLVILDVARHQPRAVAARTAEKNAQGRRARFQRLARAWRRLPRPAPAHFPTFPRHRPEKYATRRRSPPPKPSGRHHFPPHRSLQC